jgi:hypothetical protein
VHSGWLDQQWQLSLPGDDWVPQGIVDEDAAKSTQFCELGEHVMGIMRIILLLPRCIAKTIWSSLKSSATKLCDLLRWLWEVIIAVDWWLLGAGVIAWWLVDRTGETQAHMSMPESYNVGNSEYWRFELVRGSRRWSKFSFSVDLEGIIDVDRCLELCSCLKQHLGDYE